MARGGRRRRGVERDRHARKCGPGAHTAADIRRALDDEDDDDDEGNPFDARDADDDARLEVFAIRTVAGDVNRREIATFPHDTARARVFAPSPSPPGDPRAGRRRRSRGRATRTARPRLRRRRRRTPRHPRRLHARLPYVARGKPDRKFVLTTRDGTCGAVVESGDAALVYRAPVGGRVGKHQMVAGGGRGGASARVWCRTRGRDPRAEPRNSSYFVAGPSSREASARRRRSERVRECAATGNARRRELANTG